MIRITDMEAIILAGGLGTRLWSALPDMPKSMAMIGSRPFLEYQMDHLISNGISRFILSVGYQSAFIRDRFKDRYSNCEIGYASEKTPLGTGGAVKNAMQHVTGDHVFIANGDSLFLSDLHAQLKVHLRHRADVTMALKPMQDFDRYGSVMVDQGGWITHFLEKQFTREGLINGGLYLFNVSTFRSLELPNVFSIEKDFFQTRIDQLKFFGFVSRGYFLDIGIPEDLSRAQYEISIFPRIDKSWTLFLDRDGVINKKMDHDYVKSLDEFEFIPGSLDALVELSRIFGRLIIVTNQQGIGKGLMTEEDLHRIHGYLLEKVRQMGGAIDAIYHAPQLEEEASPMRKPGTGMALLAKKDFPEIEFAKSIIIGDSANDLDFGKRTNMIPVMISQGNTAGAEPYTTASLTDFTELLTSLLLQHGE
jgi:D-glycero-alpha-D-manno-heptose 1-phosphate guanylyltransferase